MISFYYCNTPWDNLQKQFSMHLLLKSEHFEYQMDNIRDY